MAFDPSRFKNMRSEKKIMPVVLLLDVSYSMNDERKIDYLNEAVEEMISGLAADSSKKEIGFYVAIIIFGLEIRTHLRYTDVKDLAVRGIDKFTADGSTPLGKALQLATDMIEDKDETKRNWYRPAVVLVSDGEPNDDYEGVMHNFINSGRTHKAQRISMAIGTEADTDMLSRFASDGAVVRAEDASQISDAFNFITMSISNRAASQNPDFFPGAEKASNGIKSYKSFVSKKSGVSDDDIDDMFT